ncbi:MAG: hypothetical protein ACREAS_08690 [Nitrososphaera sp.]
MTSAESLKRELERNRWTFGLAVVIIIAFFILYASALASGIFSSPKDYAGIESVTSTLGPIVATIIGFYFGQRPVQSLTEQVQEVGIRRDRARVGLEEASDETAEQRRITDAQIGDLETQVLVRNEIIARLIRELEQRG